MSSQSCYTCSSLRSFYLLGLAAVFVCQSIVVLYLVTASDDILSKFNRAPTSFISLKSSSAQQQPQSPQDIFKCEAFEAGALSAIARATTPKCKEELKDVACRMQKNQLTPKWLPNFCLRPGATPGRSKGCFVGGGHQEQWLISSYGLNLTRLTTQQCIDGCTHSGFSYAGVRNGRECYCHGKKPPSANQVSKLEHCNMLCSGWTDAPEDHRTCGGFNATEIYDTGITMKNPAALMKPLEGGDSKATIRIAFILTLNGRALRQVTRLLRVIYRPHNIYLIHVDARQDYLFRNLLPLELNYGNVRLMRKRHASIWGGASLVNVLLDAMEELLVTDADWQYVFNLSESDFLVQPIEQLESITAANNGLNFLAPHGLSTLRYIEAQGLSKVFHECESRMWLVGDRKLPSGIRINGGSDWIGITRELAQYATGATEDSDQLVKGLKQLCKHSLLSAESFFHTLVHNSRFCDTYVDNNLRMELWRREEGCHCQQRHIVDWCGCSPMVYRMNDWEKLSTDNFRLGKVFARKFEASLDQSIMNRIEEHLLSTNVSMYLPGWESYWQSVYDADDLNEQSHLALLTIAMSLARRSLTSLTDLYKPSRIISITSYFRSDHYQGDLVLIEVDKDAQLEVLTRPLNKAIIEELSASQSTFALNSLQVGSDYDPKEKVLRNRLSVLSPGSKPVVVYKWEPQQEKGFPNHTQNSQTAQLVWFDPDDKVRFVHSIKVTNESGAATLELGTSLTPGVWTVVVVKETKRLAIAEFLITPTASQTSLFINPHTQQDSSALQNDWIGYLPSDDQAMTRRQRLRTLISNSRDGDEGSLDSLTSEFYTVKNMCVVKLPPKGSCPHTFIELKSCSDTDWSSLSPDPKSSLP